MEDIAEFLISELGPEVADYLTVEEAYNRGISISNKKLRQIADPYATTKREFDRLSQSPDGINVINAKILLNDIPDSIPDHPQFYLGLSPQFRKKFVKAALEYDPKNILIFSRIM